MLVGASLLWDLPGERSLLIRHTPELSNPDAGMSVTAVRPVATEARDKAMGVLDVLVEVPAEVALPAGEFKREMRTRRRDCSYIDAWGYAAASHLGIPFLAGDPAFKGIPNVEFVR